MLACVILDSHVIPNLAYKLGKNNDQELVQSELTFFLQYKNGEN